MTSYKQIKSIQGLRGIAALLVCIMHIVSDQKSSDRFGMFVQHIIHSIGNFGVDLFFTISGFIITWIVMKEVELPSFKKAYNFIVRRFFRIYPLFWFTLIFLFLLTFFNNKYHLTDEAYQMLSYSVIFLLTPKIPLQYSAWTLYFEIYFYVVVFFFILFCKRKYFLYFFTFWALLHFIIIEFKSYHLLKQSLDFLVSYQIFEFYFGLLVGYYLYKFNSYVIDKYIAIIAGILLFFLYTIIVYNSLEVSNWTIILLAGGSASLLIYGGVGLEQHRRLKVPKMLLYLGDISYSIYLWTFPVLGIITHINHTFVFLGNTYPLLRSLMGIILVFIISFASYRWIEKPFILLSKRLTF